MKEASLRAWETTSLWTAWHDVGKATLALYIYIIQNFQENPGPFCPPKFSRAHARGVVAVVVEAGGLDAAKSAVSLPGHSCVMRAVEAAVVDHFYGGAMIKDVVRACVASDTIADIRAFMQQHSAEFDQSSLDGGTEHRLEYTIIHSDYCRLIESHLSAALERHGKTLQAFDGL